MTINGNGKTKKFVSFEQEVRSKDDAKKGYDVWKKARSNFDPRKPGSRAELDAARNALFAILDPHVRKVKDKDGNLRVPEDKWWKLGPLTKKGELIGITIEVLDQPMRGSLQEGVNLFSAD